MSPEELQSLIDDAAYENAIGETAPAIEKLRRATAAAHLV